MNSTDQELIDRLRTEDPEFKELYEQHLEFEQKIDELLRRPPSNELHFEIEKLKKQKLQGKDKMERILVKYR